MSIYHVVSSTTNRITGKKVVNKTVIDIPRVIVLPTTLQRKALYDLAYLSSNKSFSYGAYFDATERTFIVDNRDLPNDYVITENDFCIYDGLRYQFKVVQEFEHKQATLITGKAVTGQELDQIIDLRASNWLVLKQVIPKEFSLTNTFVMHTVLGS